MTAVRVSRTVGSMHDPASVDPILSMLPLGDYETNAFVVKDEVDPGRCWIVDCGQRPGVLLDAVERAGLNVAAAEAFLPGDHLRDEVVAEDASARRMGIQGVPCFIVDGAYAVSGAQEPEYFMPLFDLISTGQAAAE